jgi:hypothetical protein
MTEELGAVWEGISTGFPFHKGVGQRKEYRREKIR